VSGRRYVPELLRDRVFRRYWDASTISMFGDQIAGIALPLAAVLALHAGAAQMGYLTALEWLPSLLFGLPVGALVDRRGRRRLMMITADLGRAALFASIPACYALHVLTLLQLYLVTFAAGTLSIAFSVSDVTLFTSIVAPEHYVDGQSLIYGSRALSFVGGPSVGGLLVQVFTAPLAIIADALSFLGSAFFLARIRPAEPPADTGKGSIMAGARFIARSGVVRASLIAVATVNFFNLMFSALYLLYAVRVLHVRAGVVGLLIGMAAIGGLLGALVTKRIAARIGDGWAYALGCLLFTAPLVGWPLAHGRLPLVLAVLFAAEFISGFGVMVLDISIGAIFAAVIPATLRSRVSGAFQAVNYGTRPVGALLGGLLGTAIGLRPALWIATLGGIGGFFLLLPSPLPRYRLPSATAAAAIPRQSDHADSADRPLTPSEPARTQDPRDTPQARHATRVDAGASGFRWLRLTGSGGRGGARRRGRLARGSGRPRR
jgi:MFS family permease